ncbi:MAG: hypothetical protein FWC50_08025 [Planctomycetaceae bacterium]|nr:hypothetical protein [Planctomycetaceae bacterium]
MNKNAARQKTLCYEPLEKRQLLAVDSGLAMLSYSTHFAENADVNLVSSVGSLTPTPSEETALVQFDSARETAAADVAGGHDVSDNYGSIHVVQSAVVVPANADYAVCELIVDGTGQKGDAHAGDNWNVRIKSDVNQCDTYLTVWRRLWVECDAIDRSLNLTECSKVLILYRSRYEAISRGALNHC